MVTGLTLIFRSTREDVSVKHQTVSGKYEGAKKYRNWQSDKIDMNETNLYTLYNRISTSCVAFLLLALRLAPLDSDSGSGHTCSCCNGLKKRQSTEDLANLVAIQTVNSNMIRYTAFDSVL